MAGAAVSATLFSLIKSYLIDHWDPIGIGPLDHLHGPEDEYDSYAHDLVKIVGSGGSRQDLEDYLAKAEDHIGVTQSPLRIKRVARGLYQMR